jgi:hypothetical protein
MKIELYSDTRCIYQCQVNCQVSGLICPFKEANAKNGEAQINWLCRSCFGLYWNWPKKVRRLNWRSPNQSVVSYAEADQACTSNCPACTRYWKTITCGAQTLNWLSSNWLCMNYIKLMLVVLKRSMNAYIYVHIWWRHACQMGRRHALPACIHCLCESTYSCM